MPKEALERLRSQNYDFLLLDIMIPAGNEPASEKWSRQLLRDVVEGTLCYPMHVFGVTEHSGIAESERQFYEENMFGFFLFDWSTSDWATRIAAKIEYLSLAIQNGAAYRLNSYDYDLLILTARGPSEFAPVKERLFGSQKGVGHPLWPDQSFFGQINFGQKQKLRSALICIGEAGLAPAATITSQAIQVLRPRTVAMLGMCAGFAAKGMKLLDVIVARESACWQEGKSLEEDDGEIFDPRAKNKNSSERLGRSIDLTLETHAIEMDRLMEARSREREYLQLYELYREHIRPVPKVRAGLIVSGSEIVASKETTDEVSRRHPSAIGLEMEIYAVYTAAKLSLGKKCEFIAIKGVADFGDKEKRDATQSYASALSADVFKLILEKDLQK